MSEKTNETAHMLEKIIHPLQPRIAIILGSGLGGLSHHIDIHQEIPYTNIPHFPVSTVEGHAGTLIVGRFGGKDILALNGRFHYYEGYSTREATFPIRVFQALGIRTLLVSNAAGGLNPSFRIGDLMVITDHINLIPDNPLRGANVPPGPRFPDMSNAYSPQLITKAKEIAAQHGIPLREGIYLADAGPCYETPAEYRMYRLLGGDAVGMSTVPEIIVARHCNIECFGISVITNSGQQSAAVSHQEVKDAADKVCPIMNLLFQELIASL